MKRIIISPTNLKAIAFFEKITKKKEEIRAKIMAKLDKAVEVKNKFNN